MLSSLLPQTLTEGVMREGGLGLAGQLMGSLDPSASAVGVVGANAAVGSAGGVSAGTSTISAGRCGAWRCAHGGAIRMSAPSSALRPGSRGTMPRAQAPLAELTCADATHPTIVEADPLGSEVLAHLDAQIASVQRLLEIVLEQGAAIRARDVHTVVRFAGLLHGELARREQIEATRSLLLERAGALLGIPAAGGDAHAALACCSIPPARSSPPRAPRSCAGCWRSSAASTPATVR